MKDIHSDDNKIQTIVDNLIRVLDFMNTEKDKIIGLINEDKDKITSNKFYSEDILRRIASDDFDIENHKTGLDFSYIKECINKFFIDTTSNLYIYKISNNNTINSIVNNIIKPLTYSDNFKEGNYFNKISKIVINTKNDTISDTDMKSIVSIYLILYNLRLINPNINNITDKNNIFYKINSITKLSKFNNIGKIILLEPKLSKEINKEDFTNHLTKFLSFFRNIFFVIFFNYDKSLSEKGSNANVLAKGLILNQNNTNEKKKK